jgi:hypothetical protein
VSYHLNRIGHNTQWGTSGLGFARATVRAVPAPLVPLRCSNKNEQKHLEILLSEKKAPAQKEAFQDLINRRFSCHSGKLISA